MSYLNEGMIVYELLKCFHKVEIFCKFEGQKIFPFKYIVKLYVDVIVYIYDDLIL